jgi:hypothetical protein
MFLDFYTPMHIIQIYQNKGHVDQWFKQNHTKYHISSIGIFVGIMQEMQELKTNSH